MLEFIQAILGILTKALPAAVNQHRKERLNELGADLFTFYIQVNETLICAEVIIAELEEFMDRMTRHAHVGDNYAIRAGNRISHPVRLQCENLITVAATMKRLNVQLHVLDGQAYAKIVVLLSSKSEVLDRLIGTMRRGFLPVPVGLAEDLEALINSAYVTYPLPNREIEAKTILDITEGAIPLDSHWDTDVYCEMSDYMNKVRPRQQVAQIRASLENIRIALEENFSINEILLAISHDRRFKHRKS